MDVSGVDAGSPWSAAALESLQCAGNALSIQLAIRDVQRPPLVGYLAPIRLAYTVQVLTTLFIAGTGAYVLGRVLRLGVLGCVTAATIYELSGPFLGFLGWPIAGVMSWGGWIFAAAIVVIRGHHRLGGVVFLAVVLASALYAGQPGTVALLAVAVVVFVVVLVVTGAYGSPTRVACLRPLMDLAVASVTGAALAAPLLLPGTQLLSQSIFRNVQHLNHTLPSQDVFNLILQGFNGLPLARTQFFGVGAAAYVGVIAVVLAVMGLARRRKQPQVLAFGAVALAMAALAFLPPVVALANTFPYRARWSLAVVLLAFCIAVLAGVGMDVLVRSRGEHAVRSWCAGGFVAAALVLLELWFFGRGHLPRRARSSPGRELHLAGHRDSGRTGGDRVPGCRTKADCAARRDRDPPPNAAARGMWAGAALVICETCFLVGVGGPLFSSSSTFFAPTAAISTLQHAVGSSVVGFGTRSCQVPPTIGILQEANVAYEVHEFAAYDPLSPRVLFQSWRSMTGQEPSAGLPVSVFCPVVTTAAIAREYGVAFVLEPRGVPGPRGGVFDKAIGDETLFRVPNSSQATVVAIPTTGTLPPSNAVGVAVPVSHPDPAALKVVVRFPTTNVLRLRITAVPGWHATIDGQPLRLQRFAGVMLQGRIPPGRHTVVLRYWPASFTAGIGLAVAAVVGLIVALVIGRTRRRTDTRRRSDWRPPVPEMRR